MIAWLLFLLIVLGWGSTFFAIRIGLDTWTPEGLVSLRNLLAAGASLLAARLLGEKWPARRDWPRIAGVGLLLVAAGNFFTAQAQRTLSTGVAGLLNACISLWIVVLAARQERMPRRVWVGVALGLAGVALLLLPGDRIRIHPAGFGFMMLAGFLFSLGALLQRSRPATGGTFAVLTLQMGTAGVVLAVFALAQGGFTHAAPTPRTIQSLLYLAIFPSLLTYAAFASLSRRWPPSRFGTYAVLTPVVAVVLGTLLLGEPLTPRILTAMAIILGGVALVQRR